jgi:aryl-alcohol dehydrogenase-like predicted oxidoreductase
VILKEALANGRLTSRGSAGEIGALAQLAARLRCAPDAVALAAALSQPWADVVLSGAATVEHLGSNLAAASLRLGPRDASALADLAEPPETYWRKRAALAWN